MKVAMVVYSHYSRDARVRRYAQSLAHKKNSVYIVCLRENYKPKQNNIHLLHYPLERRRGGQFWYVVEYVLFFLFSFLLLSWDFFKHRYNFVHIHNMPDFLVFSSLIPKLFGAKIILDLHDLMPELYRSKYQSEKSNHIHNLLETIEGLSCRFADVAITANDRFKEILLKRHPALSDKLNVILNCPDPSIFKPEKKVKTKSELFRLLYMGTVEKRFALDIAVAGIQILQTRIPNIRFTIIPKIDYEGPYLTYLRQLIATLGLENHVEIVSPLPLEAIAKTLRTVQAGVVLARNNVFTENIFPVKLLEFIQMGVPVVATYTQTLGKYFTDKDLLFIRKNKPEEFSCLILKLYKNIGLRNSLCANAKKYLVRHNWPAEEKKYQMIIKNLI